jgi:hypothetical protein
MQDYNFECGFIWVRNLVSVIKEETKGVWEQGAEEDIWIEVRWSDRWMEKAE